MSHLKITITLQFLITQIVYIYSQSYSNYGCYDYSAYNYPPGTVEAAGLQCSLQQIYNTYYPGQSYTSSSPYGYNNYQPQKSTEYIPSSTCEQSFPPSMTQQIIIVNEDDDGDKDVPIGELLNMLLALKDDEDDEEAIMYPYPVPYPVPCCCGRSDDCGKCRCRESDFADFDLVCEKRGNRNLDCGHCSKRRENSPESYRGKSKCKYNRDSSCDKISHRLFCPDCEEDSCGYTRTYQDCGCKTILGSRKENLNSKKLSSCRSRGCDCESCSRYYEY